jgi:YVTN family beta-propeller protein
MGLLVAMVLPISVWMACGQVYRPVVIPCSTGGVPGCPVETPPQPANFHAVFGISTNLPSTAGAAMQIDVSGDSLIGETSTSTASAPNTGFNPTHAAIAPNDSRLFVATAASVFPGGIDAVAAVSPAFQSTLSSGFGPVSMITLPSMTGQSAQITALNETGNTVTATLSSPLLASPNRADLALLTTPIVVAGEANLGFSAYNGTFTITGITSSTPGPATVQYDATVTGLPPCAPNALPIPPCPLGGMVSIPVQPVYLASIENTAMYVANFNSNSVAKINTATNVVTNAASVEPALPASVTPAPNPVSMAEVQSPNGLKLYTANQGNNTVSSLNSVDLSTNTVTGFTNNLMTPVWVTARTDGQKVYVLTEGDGSLVTIDTATDTVTSSLSVEPGANFIFYDPTLNRLYVTNPVTQTVYVFSDTGGLVGGVVSDVPVQLAAISFATGTGPGPCLGGCTPVSVTALLDGSRFYVATYQAPAACPSGTGVTGACVVPGLTVFNANTFALQYPNAPTLELLGTTPFAAGQYAVPQVATCAMPIYPALYSPSSTLSPTRFRVFTAASEDSSRVYVSMCDAGAIAVINTTGGNTNNSGNPLPPDSVVTDLLAAPEANNALQNPIFLLMGQ